MRKTANTWKFSSSDSVGGASAPEAGGNPKEAGKRMATSETVAMLKRELALGEGGGVTVQHFRGRVLVRSGAGARLRVEAELPPGLRWEIAPEGAGDWLVRSIPPAQGPVPEAACTLFLPAGARLEVHLAEGLLRLEGVEARARLDTISADIVLEGGRGAWHLRSVSGDIHASGLEGSLSVQTVSGDVRLKACRVSEMQARSVAGGFTLETPLAEGPYTFRTLGGDIVLLLPQDTNCEVDFRTLSGDMEIAFSSVYFPKQGASRRVMVGEGGVQVGVSTLSGNLWLSASPPGARSRPAAPPAA